MRLIILIVVRASVTLRFISGAIMQSHMIQFIIAIHVLLKKHLPQENAITLLTSKIMFVKMRFIRGTRENKVYTFKLLELTQEKFYSKNLLFLYTNMSAIKKICYKYIYTYNFYAVLAKRKIIF